MSKADIKKTGTADQSTRGADTLEPELVGITVTVIWRQCERQFEIR